MSARGISGVPVDGASGESDLLESLLSYEYGVGVHPPPDRVDPGLGCIADGGGTHDGNGILFADGIIRPIVEKLETGSWFDVARTADTLREIACMHPANQDAIFRQGGIHSIVRLLCGGTPAIAAPTIVRAMYAIAHDNVPIQQYIQSSGIIPSLIDLLSLMAYKATEYPMRLLEYMVVGNPTNKALCCSLHGICSLLHLASFNVTQDTSATVLAIDVVNSLISESIAGCANAREAGWIPFLLECTTRCTDTPLLAWNSAWTLFTMCKYDHLTLNLRAVCDAGGARHLMKLITGSHWLYPMSILLRMCTEPLSHFIFKAVDDFSSIHVLQEARGEFKKLCERLRPHYARYFGEFEFSEDADVLSSAIAQADSLNVDPKVTESAITRLRRKELGITIPNEFECPITRCEMKDPVLLSDGFSYERKVVENNKKICRSPITREKLDMVISNGGIIGPKCTPNIILKKLIRDFEDIIEKATAKRKDAPGVVCGTAKRIRVG